MGFVLGGEVMRLIDITGAIAAHRHARTPMVTASVERLQFLHPIHVGDLIVFRARVTAAFTTSLEVEVEVFSESILTGDRRRASVAYLTFVTLHHGGERVLVPGLQLDTDEDRQKNTEAQDRRATRLARQTQQADVPSEPA
jgi:acyl-CoA hydrolase